MDRITQSDVVSFHEHVQSLVSKNSQLNLQNFVLDLLNSKLFKLPEKESKDCQIEYKFNNLEFRMWSLALLSTSWIVTMLKQKTEDGHCSNVAHEHGKREPRKCHAGHDFHLDIYNECVSSFKDIIKIAEENQPRNI
jgi:hypothetical protein